MTRPARAAMGILAVMAFGFIAWRIFTALTRIAVALLTLAVTILIFLVRMGALELERWRLKREISANGAATLRDYDAG
jgi:hypothetical protein